MWSVARKDFLAPNSLDIKSKQFLKLPKGNYSQVSHATLHKGTSFFQLQV